jgi:hypothetical protein
MERRKKIQWKVVHYVLAGFIRTVWVILHKIGDEAAHPSRTAYRSFHLRVNMGYFVMWIP